MDKTATPQLRKDAALNRERLLAAAAELFASQGLNVTLNDIAHHAGVGVGTAYRRFPNKEAVIDALFEQRMSDVAAVAEQSLAEPDAWVGLTMFLEQALHMRHGDRGLNEIMNNPVLGDERVSEVRDRIAPIITKLVAKARDQGVVRPDLDQSDLIFIQLGLSAIIEKTGSIAPGLYRRYLTMFLDGIRTDRQGFTPLPAAPLNAAKAHEAMTTERRSATR